MSTMSGLPEAPIAADGTSLARVHMIGIGGAGMSAIARIMSDRGLPLSGSDAKGSHVVTGLAQRGVLTAIGHRAENLDLLPGGPTAVVVSTAIRPSNPELVEAHPPGPARGAARLRAGRVDGRYPQRLHRRYPRQDVGPPRC